MLCILHQILCRENPPIEDLSPLNSFLSHLITREAFLMGFVPAKGSMRSIQNFMVMLLIVVLAFIGDAMGQAPPATKNQTQSVAICCMKLFKFIAIGSCCGVGEGEP